MAMASQQVRFSSFIMAMHAKVVCVPHCRNSATAWLQSAAAAANVATSQRTAKDVVQEFYTRYNKGDVDGIMELFADECEYHDMIYADPFTGKEQIRAFFAKFSSTISKDLQFVVDGISGGDPNNTGVKW